MHPRACVSAISTFDLALDEDLAFWERHDIDTVGVSVAKLERFGWDAGTELVADAVARGLRVANLIGLGPFDLADPASWPKQQDRLVHSHRHRGRGRRRVHRVHDRPVRAAHVGGGRRHARGRARTRCSREREARGIPFAIEHTNSLRVDVGFVHTLQDAIDLARRLDVGVCMELNACWAERALAATIRDGIDRIRLVQVSDFKVGTVASSQRLVPGDGDIPIARILGVVLDAGYAGVFDLELIGDAIVAEGYDAAVPRAVDALGRDARPSSAPEPAPTDVTAGPTRRPGRRGPTGISRPSIAATAREVRRRATRRPCPAARAAAPPTPARPARPVAASTRRCSSTAALPSRRT